MTRVLSVVRKALWEVDARLHQLGLDRSRLVKVRNMARSASADATPFHPINAPGTLAYQHGTFGLRDEFVGRGWELARPEGVEAIFNIKANAMLAFANVDVACNDFNEPKPRSRKGSGSERVAQGSLFGVSLPQFAPRRLGGTTLFYLMVDDEGATELSVPVVENGTFVAYLERNFLLSGAAADPFGRIEDNDDVVDNFDPQVIRKSG